MVVDHGLVAPARSSDVDVHSEEGEEEGQQESTELEVGVVLSVIKLVATVVCFSLL